MTTTTDTLEQQRLLEIAHEYRQKGYQVVVAPSQSNLPEFLAKYELDLIAQNKEENVVVEVKSRTTLSQFRDLPALVQAIQERPGWRFELVVTNPREKPIDKGEYRPLAAQNILDRLTRTTQLLDLGYSDAALLLAWAATEATMRLVGEREGIEVKDRVPFSTAKTLFSLGLLSRDDYEILEKGFQLRNAIVHGYEATTLNSELINNMTEVTQRLLRESETSG